MAYPATKRCSAVAVNTIKITVFRLTDRYDKKQRNKCDGTESEKPFHFNFPPVGVFIKGQQSMPPYDNSNHAMQNWPKRL